VVREVVGQNGAGADFVEVMIFSVNPEYRHNRHAVIVTGSSGELDCGEGLEECEQRATEEPRLLSGDDCHRSKGFKGPGSGDGLRGRSPGRELRNEHGGDLGVRSGTRLTRADETLPHGRIQRGPGKKRLETVERVTVVAE
jgi:hypothetical protein